MSTLHAATENRASQEPSIHALVHNTLFFPVLQIYMELSKLIITGTFCTCKSSQNFLLQKLARMDAKSNMYIYLCNNFRVHFHPVTKLLLFIPIKSLLAILGKALHVDFHMMMFMPQNSTGFQVVRCRSSGNLSNKNGQLNLHQKHEYSRDYKKCQRCLICSVNA